MKAVHESEALIESLMSVSSELAALCFHQECMFTLYTYFVCICMCAERVIVVLREARAVCGCVCAGVYACV